MQYASTYSMGGPPHDGASVPSYEPLPAPKPSKLHWSTLLFGGGMVVCFLGLLVTLAGVPGSLGYDADAPGERNKPTSSDPLAVQRSMDANMRWIAENSNDEPGHYVGSIKSINNSEAAIPAMVQGLAAMAASVTTIDSELGEVYATSQAMGDDMTAMTEGSAQSADRMDALAADVDVLAVSMRELGKSAELLTQRMTQIQAKADGIAKNGTAKALESTRAMNESLPATVPAPEVEGGGGSDVMTGLEAYQSGAIQ